MSKYSSQGSCIQVDKFVNLTIFLMIHDFSPILSMIKLFAETGQDVWIFFNVFIKAA